MSRDASDPGSPEFELRISGGTCATCGKRMFTSKPAAKLAIRRMKGRVGKIRAYRCGQRWHIGHTPSAVIRGDLPRDQINQRRRHR